MQVDRINANTIRVRINKDELARRGLRVLDLLGDKNKIQQFFYSILDEVDTNHMFSKESPVTFQVMPSGGGLELLISKVVRGNRVRPASPASRPPQQPFADLGDGRRTQIGNVNSLKQSYKFKDIDQVAELADNLRVNNLASSLYFYRGEFYLELAFLDSGFAELNPADAWSVANEYGIKVADKDFASVKEVGRRLLGQDALGHLRTYFKEKQY